MKVIVAALLAIVGTGCASTMSPDNSLNDRKVAFSCANGESLSVRFLQAQSLAILMRNGDSIELPQQPSGSGFIYSNGPNTIRGKGDDLTVEIGRMVPIQCKAQGTGQID